NEIIEERTSRVAIPPLQRGQKPRDHERGDEIPLDYEMIKDDGGFEYGQQPQFEEVTESAQTSPLSAWDKVRERAKTDRKQKNSTNADDYSYINKSQQTLGRRDENINDGFMEDTTFNLPRTREELEEISRSGKIRTNQYGDPEIRYE
ncbi:1957_t:CDS:2, partial [Acaulospora colombiana]